MPPSFQTVDKAPSCEGALSTVCLFIVIFSFPNHASYFYSTIFLYRVQVVTDGSYK